MIARRTLVGAVCFRCRLRLLYRLTPTRYVASDAANHAIRDAVNSTTGDAANNTTADAVNNTIDDSARSAFENAFKSAVHDPVSDPARDTASDTASDAASDRVNDTSTDRPVDDSTDQDHAARPPSGTVFRRLDFRKRHLSGRRILTETTTKLGADVLGKPAYAIIMRDGGDVRKRGDPVQQVPPDTGTAETGSESTENLTAGIQDILEKQREIPTAQEVRSNIEELQPQNKILSEKDFRKIQSLLADGFLTSQLLDYMEWHRSDPERQAELTAAEKASEPQYPWIVKMTPWRPLAHVHATKGTDRTLQRHISGTMSPKEKLAVRLMCKCWGLSIAEPQAPLGETTIKLHNYDFILLMRGTRRFLNALGKFWLEPGEKIEMMRNQKALQLVSTKQKTESILADLDRTLKSVTMKTFPVKLFASQAPDDEVLEEVGRITNTHVRKDGRSTRLHVTWIEPDSRVVQDLTELEDVSHIVFRLLLTASKSQETPSTLLSPTLPQESSGRLIVDVMNKDKLMWKERLAQWARYVLPHASEENSVLTEMPIKKLPLPFEPFRETELWEERLKFVSDGDAPPLRSVEWSNTSRTSTVARFGQLLHRYNPSNPAPPISDLLASTDGRVFSPTTPHPLYLAKYETTRPYDSPLTPTKSTVVLYFWPSPSSNPPPKESKSAKSRKRVAPVADAPPAPILELRLIASDRVIRGIESLRAIRRTHHTDVMLPSSPVDVRFTQTQYETLQVGDHENLADWQPLADFLKRARLDLENGKLEMPPRQRFPIPLHLFTKSVLEQSTMGEKLASVLYEFVGLELHRSVSQSYNGHQLTYTSIEAGQGGGRRAEVTLEPLERPHPGTPADEDGLQAFLGCCSRFVADRALWHPLVNEKADT